MVTTAYDSLVVGEAIELWGPPGGIASVNPMCPGAIFRVQPPFSLDAPQPTTDFIASLIVDGEKPFGDRASDRTITLNVLIKAPDYRTLAGARELLLKTIDQPHWPLTWTRASGADPTSLPLILDCFRAQPSVIPMGGPEEFRVQNRNQVEAQVTVKFQALPYGRSDTQQQIAFASPIASINSPGAPPAPVVLDAFTTINSTQCVQSTQSVVGPKSCYWDPRNPPFDRDDGQNCPLTYSAALAPPVNLGGMTGLSMWLGLGSRHYFNHHPRGQTRVVLSFTLTDTNGVVLSWSDKSRWLPVSADPQAPVFTRVTVRIPQNSGTFNYGSVAAYSLTITNRAPRWDTPGGELRWTVAYLDALTAYSSSQVIAAPSIRGNVYTLHGVAGTHRAPISTQFQSAPTAGTPTTITATGAGTYTVPGGTLYLKVEAVGGGGAGATQTTSGQGGGGGGAEYAAETVFSATAGQVIPYVVGTGGIDGAAPVPPNNTVFGPAPSGTLSVIANAGSNAVQNNPAGGAGGSGSTNTVHFPGGTGRTASGGFGGGGGGSGGNSAPGNVPQGTGTVLFTSGSSTWLCPAGVTQVLAECWGAGGGGGNSQINDQGGGGGGGEYAAQLVAVTPGNNYPYTVGTGGAGNAGTGDGSGGTGNNSTFAGDTFTVIAHSGQGGISDDPSGSGAAQGGTGSNAATHFHGGAGGIDDPYRGGGGSSAGPAARGNDGGSPNGATAPAGGGSGGNSGGSGSNGTAGSAPGGGGGGADNNGVTGGAGAAGQVRLTYPGGVGAPTNLGATAVPGGGAGGNGGATTGTTGSVGAQPGGGGGGGNSSGVSEAGGNGGAGRLIITPFSSPAFKTLIVHRPGRWSPVNLNPFVPVGAGLVAPGSTEYTVPSLVSGVNADFNGTYTVILTNFSFSSPGSSRTISVTVRQYEAPSGAHYDTTTTPITIVPNTQAVNGILVAGTLTLPLKASADDNTSGFYTILVSDTNGSDRWYDCLLLDVQGQTVIVNEPATGYINYYFDEPDPCHDLGNYLGSQAGRPAAISVMDAITISGGPLTVEPGINTLMAYAQEGAPSIAVSYWPRWFSERLE